MIAYRGEKTRILWTLPWRRIRLYPEAIRAPQRYMDMATPLLRGVALLPISCYWPKAIDLRGLGTESPRATEVRKNRMSRE